MFAHNLHRIPSLEHTLRMQKLYKKFNASRVALICTYVTCTAQYNVDLKMYTHNKIGNDH
jgi:hypothetical protein